MEVSLLIIYTPDTIHVSVCTTPGAALAALAGYVKANWWVKVLGPMPTRDQEAIDEFFNAFWETDSYEIRESVLVNREEQYDHSR